MAKKKTKKSISLFKPAWCSLPMGLDDNECHFCCWICSFYWRTKAESVQRSTLSSPFHGTACAFTSGFISGFLSHWKNICLPWYVQQLSWHGWCNAIFFYSKKITQSEDAKEPSSIVHCIVKYWLSLYFSAFSKQQSNQRLQTLASLDYILYE